MINNKKAFTLVELLVTITIVSVLATIAFISFQ
jgi:prepilin-type N-terminal cleavage/methylation domain-containing protein